MSSCRVSKENIHELLIRFIEMLMSLQLVGLCAVLCTILFSESEATVEPPYDVIDLALENSYTFTANVNLYTVWLTNTSLHVNSTGKNIDSCNISIDPTTDYTLNQIEVKALPSGSFVVWGMRRDTGSYPWHETEYTVLLVNPWSCTYKPVPVPIYKRDSKDISSEILVVANSDGFDVFFPSMKTCSPCRFDIKGKRVELQHQLEFASHTLTPFVMPRGIHIEPMHPIDRKYGYFFARNFNNDTSVMKHLDENFETIKQVYVDHPVHTVSIWPGKDLFLSICYNSYSDVYVKRGEIHCQQLDSNLQTKLSIRIPAPLPANDHSVYGVLHFTHQVDLPGNIYVGLTEYNVDEKTYKYEPRFLRYFAYDRTGKLLKSHNVDLGIAKFNPITEIPQTNYYRDFLHSHLLVGDKYCLVNHEYVDNNREIIHEVTRCFNIHEYYTKTQK